jgi:hypothetical protein
MDSDVALHRTGMNCARTKAHRLAAGVKRHASHWNCEAPEGDSKPSTNCANTSTLALFIREA